MHPPKEGAVGPTNVTFLRFFARFGATLQNLDLGKGQIAPIAPKIAPKTYPWVKAGLAKSLHTTGCGTKVQLRSVVDRPPTRSRLGHQMKLQHV